MFRLVLLAVAVGAAMDAEETARLGSAVRALATSASVLGELSSGKQHYDAAMVLIALSEAVRLGALDEADARAVLDATRYERERFAAGGDDGSTDVIPFVRGEYDADDDETRGGLTGKSVGDWLSITAGLLTPQVWDDAVLSMERAKSVVFDLQFVDDATLGGASDDLGFLTSTETGLSFYRQKTTYRTQDNSGGSTESDGWNPEGFRDENKVCWEDDVAMGTATAAMLVAHHLDALSADERDRVGDVFAGLARGYDDVFGDLRHAYDATLGEASPMRWTRSIGWGLYGLSLIRRTLATLGRDGDAAAAADVIVDHLETVVAWQGASGLWWQVPDGPSDGSGAPSDDGGVNFVETSGSALILAAMGELAAVDALPATMVDAYDDGVRGLLKYVDGEGAIRQCGRATSIGAAASYYYSRGVDDADECSKAGLVLLALAHAAASRPTPAPTPRPTASSTSPPTTPAPTSSPAESDGALVATVGAIAAAAWMLPLVA